MTIRVLLADDHPLFLDGLRLLLESAGMEVVGVAHDGDELLELARQEQADVAVVDLDMPGRGGASATEQLRQHRPDVSVLVLSMHDDDASVTRALRAGARGYVVKGAGHGAVVRAVRAVADGDAVLSGGVGLDVLRSSGGPTQVLPGLTGREHQVLDLVARGHGNAAIARELYLSLKTVQNHVSNIFGKLDVSTRAQAVALARDLGLGAAPE